MTVFKSKIDFWLIGLLGASLILPLIIAVMAGVSLLIMLVALAPAIAIIVWLLAVIRYTVSEGILKVHAGLYTVNIAVDSIKSVKNSRSFISSPALSLDRMEIKYGNNKTVLISPRDKAGFLAAIGWSKPLAS